MIVHHEAARQAYATTVSLLLYEDRRSLNHGLAAGSSNIGK